MLSPCRPLGPFDDDPRQNWRAARQRLEGGSHRSFFGFHRMAKLFGLGLKVTGLYGRGLRNAHDIRLTRLELSFPDLPEPFDGFRILQLSDLHADYLPGPVEAAIDLAAAEPVDLCVLTGDYRMRMSGPHEQILPPLERLMGRVQARHGVQAILGNHDCAAMVAPFEALGMDVLVNETRSLTRGGAEIHITGTDDVHAFHSADARRALEAAPEGFKIALIHSAEFADVAAATGHRLYLAGHTHAGQICLPGGRPVVTHLRRHRRYAAGLWRHGDMQGYTTSGVGVSALPVRFNSRGEVARITLRKGRVAAL